MNCLRMIFALFVVATNLSGCGRDPSTGLTQQEFISTVLPEAVAPLLSLPADSIAEVEVQSVTNNTASGETFADNGSYCNLRYVVVDEVQKEVLGNTCRGNGYLRTVIISNEDVTNDFAADYANLVDDLAMTWDDIQLQIKEENELAEIIEEMDREVVEEEVEVDLQEGSDGVDNLLEDDEVLVEAGDEDDYADDDIVSIVEDEVFDFNDADQQPEFFLKFIPSGIPYTENIYQYSCGYGCEREVRIKLRISPVTFDQER